ncbi:MAG: PHP domain-containing protein [Candidatus Lokiarchaeota archaeon]|nr:PHP domain-containing protein [Candidatus Lokiarchaeota archaeon]
MELPNINLHIHSKYSDGKNSISQIVSSALDKGLDYICISDHFTNSWKADMIPNLNSLDKIKMYLEEITQFQELLIEEDRQMALFKGIEIDLSSTEKFIINNIIPTQFDLIMFEYLENIEGISFIKKIIHYWKRKTKNPKDFPLIGLAHFDPSFFIFNGMTILIDFLKQNQIFFEFNSSYPQYYSQKFRSFFDQLRENNILVSIGCDSHHISTLKDVEEAYDRIKLYALEENLKNLIQILDKKLS